MNDKIVSIKDYEHKRWISELKKRYYNSQIKPTVKVSNELFHPYRLLGRDIHGARKSQNMLVFS